MPKSKILPIRKSAERFKDVYLKDVRLKEANFELIDLTRFQIDAIMQRKNPVNGRYVAALNGKKQILEMYPNLLAPFVGKSQEQINQSPLQRITPNAANAVPAPSAYVEPAIKSNLSTTQAPEFAPPPIIPLESFDELPAIESQYRIDAASPAAVSPMQIAPPIVTEELSEQAQKQAFIETARTEVLRIYDAGAAAATVRDRALNEQTQAPQNSDIVNQTVDTLNNVRLAA